MLQKWQSSPQRVGMVAGFVLLPLLWWLQDTFLFSVFGFGSRPESGLLICCVASAIPGSMLGAGISKAILAWRDSQIADAKWYLMSHATAVLLLLMLLLGPESWRRVQNFSGKVALFDIFIPRWLAVLVNANFLTFLPLHVALLLLFVGLLLRPRR